MRDREREYERERERGGNKNALLSKHVIREIYGFF